MLFALMNSTRSLNLYPNEHPDYHDTCIRDAEIEYYWETEDMKDNDERIHVATVKGTLVITREIPDDPCVVCDDIDQDLGYVMTTAFEEFEDDLFYIREYKVDPKVKFPLTDMKDPDYRIEKGQLLPFIIDTLADTILNMMGTRPQAIVTYPEPLPYEEDAAVKDHRERAQRILANKMDVNIERWQSDNPQNHIIISIDQKGSVTQDDINYMMGSGGGYPEIAKNQEEFDMWESVNFAEIEDSRVMIYYPDDPMLNYKDGQYEEYVNKQLEDDGESDDGFFESPEDDPNLPF